MLFARKNVHLGYMSPPGQTLRALNHSFFQRKRRPRSSDGHKPMHFLWETHTLVTTGPRGLTSRALNHSFSILTVYIVAMGSHRADFMALNMLKSYGASHSSLRAELPPCNCSISGAVCLHESLTHWLCSLRRTHPSIHLSSYASIHSFH